MVGRHAAIEKRHMASSTDLAVKKAEGGAG